jgi:aminoglycoside phosphotransferase (APT) family kinase protein
LLRSALAALRTASPPPIVSDRVPWLLASGSHGLAQWTAERRLAGAEPSRPLTEALLDECVEFLAGLHGAGRDGTHTSLLERVETIASVCAADDAAGVQRVGERVESTLADVPRGFVHGDFWIQNLLTDGGHLTGVVDWHGAEAAGLPLIDLFHLRLSEVFERTRKYLGTVLVEQLLPWARAGGDDVARTYCRRVGIAPTAGLLEALVVAYWITRTARELELYADRVERPVWMRHNVTLVARAIARTGELNSW